MGPPGLLRGADARVGARRSRRPGVRRLVRDTYEARNEPRRCRCALPGDSGLGRRRRPGGRARTDDGDVQARGARPRRVRRRPRVEVRAGRARAPAGHLHVDRRRDPRRLDGGDRRFVERVGRASEPDRVLATILFTDIVGSSARAAALGDRAWRDLLRTHHTQVRRRLAEFRGEELDVAGDGFLAAFDGPGRAIRCACAIRDDLAAIDLELRAGVHTGECERLDGKLSGIAVHTGARIAGAAQAGEVLVSSTVTDLVAGSGIEFDERGTHELKGVPGEWRLYAVVDA
ncbi:MAG TPA: adenylate/guanylate cyclase domain-containing protein [Gaiellaceae bacterium]|nr:adenylate/guanylate cyclase domain-containing protein [Gaiellaceae bacterium]